MVLRSIVMRVLPRHRFVWVACGWGLIGIRRDRTRLLDRTACRTIRDIRAREFERPPAVVAAAGVELRGMVCEGEQVSPKKLIEAKPCGVELCLGLCSTARAFPAVSMFLSE
jgi:hypothetical protein